LYAKYAYWYKAACSIPIIPDWLLVKVAPVVPPVPSELSMCGLGDEAPTFVNLKSWLVKDPSIAEADKAVLSADGAGVGVETWLKSRAGKYQSKDAVPAFLICTLPAKFSFGLVAKLASPAGPVAGKNGGI